MSSQPPHHGGPCRLRLRRAVRASASSWGSFLAADADRAGHPGVRCPRDRAAPGRADGHVMLPQARAPRLERCLLRGGPGHRCAHQLLELGLVPHLLETQVLEGETLGVRGAAERPVEEGLDTGRGREAARYVARGTLQKTEPGSLQSTFSPALVKGAVETQP